MAGSVRNASGRRKATRIPATGGDTCTPTRRPRSEPCWRWGSARQYLAALTWGRQQQFLIRPPGGANLTSDPGARPARPRTLDEEFSAVAQEVPGFGGMFYDESGDLVLYLTDPSRVTAATEALVRRFGSEILAPSARSPLTQVRVRQGQYDYRRLHSWYNTIVRSLSIQGVVLFDIQEAWNRIHIQFESQSALDNARERMASLDLDLDPGALVLTVGPPIGLASHTVQDRIRPIVGGIQVVSEQVPGSFCTLGFNVLYEPALNKGWVTASHCSSVRGDVGDDFHQANVNNHVGMEVKDPPFFEGGECPAGRRCRYSDALIVWTDPGVPDDLGRIAKTQFARQYDPGSLEIDHTYPHFTIVQWAQFTFVGQYLEKVGRTTGWTVGDVAETCVAVDIPLTDITMLCTDFVKALAQPGDSGSPVFWMDWGYPFWEVRLHGVLWGRRFVDGLPQFAFSRISWINAELGHVLQDLVTH